jgi:hypothetical protein
MSVPNVGDDGNFAVAQQNGSHVFENPLSDVGDFDHFVARVKYRIEAPRYTSPSTLTPGTFTAGTGNLIGYLVRLSSPNLVGSNLMEWEATYANKPSQRTEPATITYTQQWLARSDDNTYSIEEHTDSRDATIVYDYYFKTQPLPALIAPKLALFANRIFQFGGWRVFNDGESVLAQDSTSERYLGDIFVRKSVYITWAQRVPFTL